jgi:hypothetical protein
MRDRYDRTGIEYIVPRHCVYFSGAALMWGVAKCTIMVLFCYLKQTTATRPAARAGLLWRMPLLITYT